MGRQNWSNQVEKLKGGEGNQIKLVATLYTLWGFKIKRLFLLILVVKKCVFLIFKNTAARKSW